jgi:hypothetical protein
MLLRIALLLGRTGNAISINRTATWPTGFGAIKAGPARQRDLRPAILTICCGFQSGEQARSVSPAIAFDISVPRRTGEKNEAISRYGRHAPLQ